ncbi:uncharacterized protein K02A2.6-like [Anastrepha obliqua]|uniref:uncharacterized protein K02A2.6-like n=1 Tax=Anastrepha obliqua TaxID=95512 RepID=UPI002409C228|nr:uncharacterized protein K02A2.6-like [Anastrepha obliqua]
MPEQEELMKLLQMQSKLLEQLTQRSKQPVENSKEQLMESLAKSIAEFCYDATNALTFDTWYARHEDVFLVDGKDLDEASRVRLLMRKLNPIAYNNKNQQEDLVSYAARVNAQCEKFRLSELSADQFKCLIYVFGLQAHTEADIRIKILAKLEEDSQQTLNSLVSHAKKFINLKKDTAMVEETKAVITNVIHANTRQSKNDATKNSKTNKAKIPKTPCWNCGDMHYAKYCTYRNKKCNKCNKYGHKEGYCNSHSASKSKSTKPQRHKQQQTSNKGHNSCLQVNSITYVNRRKYTTVSIKPIETATSSFPSCDVRMQVDTASDVSLIGKSTWIQMGQPGIRLENKYVTSASKDKIQLLAEFSYQQSTILKHIQQDYADIFKPNLENCSTVTSALHLKPDAKQIFRAKRPVAYSMLPYIEEELNRLHQLGVITPVEFSEWAAPIVAVKKPSGKVRICGDYSSGLNAWLGPHQYPLHTPEEIYAKVAGSHCFTVIDLSDAYLQIPVTAESAKLLTINTHMGLFTFNRLAPGIKSAPGAFQQIMDTILAGIDDTVAYIDDIIIGGATFEKHVENLHKVAQQLQKYKFRAQFDKCKFFAAQVKYLGNILSKTDLMLTHYNPNLPLKVATDASNRGIGAFICHVFPDGSEKVIQHASKALTDAEQKYSQIEKEALALVFALKKFHRFIFGRKFTLCTDHKPLIAIFGKNKGIPTYAANRLQRWALILMMYDFNIQYIKTTEFGCVDMLSRLIANHTKQDEDMVIACTQMEEEMNTIIEDQCEKLPVSFEMIRKATKQCSTAQAVINALSNGWKQEITTELQPLYARKDALSVIQECLMFHERIVIPKKLQLRILRQLHRGHLGRERMKLLARSYVYWPGVDEDIVSYSRNCQHCASTAKMPVKHTVRSWPLATKPMERLHIDIAGPCNSFYYFVIVDTFSKWPEIFQIENITTQTIISKLNETLSRYGDCDTLVSDNGTQFTSGAFEQFVTSQGIQHIRTSPYHPQSNGQAERFVDTLKRALKKLKMEGTDSENLQTFLQTYRFTPNPSVVERKSPAEAFLNRKIKTTLDLTKPQTTEIKQRNLKQENQFNVKHGAKSREFSNGDLVNVKWHQGNDTFWVPGVIIERIGSVNYNVRIEVKGNLKLIRSHANKMVKRYGNHTGNRNVTKYLCDVFDLTELPRFNEENQPVLQPETVEVAPLVETTSSGSNAHAGTNRGTSTSRRIRRPPAYLNEYDTS